MAKCVIFNAGAFDDLIEPIGADDLVLAADGGLIHTTRLGITPHAVLGDFDSLGYVPEDAICFPREKDDTDSMLAIRIGLEKGYRSFVLYGALDGPRIDHSIANFQALQFLANNSAQGFLVGAQFIATVVKNSSLVLNGTPNGLVSVFCMGADASGITLQGLKYPLNNATLSAGFPLGVSNRFAQARASICVEQGSLLILYDRKAGLPQ